MINLPDHGYTEARITPVNPGGVAEGSMGGPSDYIDRPGYRYSVTITTPPLPTENEARLFQSLLEQASRDDASYPFPLDAKAFPAGTPLINGSTPPGSVINLKGLPKSTQVRIGQPLAVILADGTGFIHKATAVASSDDSGHASVIVFPLTRTTFADGLTVEIERPRIRGILQWDGAPQGAFGRRSFTFTITERR